MAAMGIDDVEQFAEMTLAEKLEQMSMSPEQRELAQLKAEKEERTRQEAELRRLQEQEQMSRAEAVAQKQYNDEFVAAWKETGLPPNRLFGQLLAAEMVSARERGEELQWKDAAVKLKSKFSRSVREILEATDASQYQDVLGDVVLKKIREHQLKSLSNQPPGLNGPGQKRSEDESSVPRQRQSKQKAMTEKDYRAYLQKLKG
jgi:hypothetical protein